MTKPCGILIFGANGSGKTTLGRELARILSFKHMDHEDYAFEEAVARELKEEIGCKVTGVGDLIMSVTEYLSSEASPGKCLEQVNLYYRCEIDDTAPYTPQPTQEELPREHESVWIDLREALHENEPIPQRARDVAVLRMLLED